MGVVRDEASIVFVFGDEAGELAIDRGDVDVVGGLAPEDGRGWSEDCRKRDEKPIEKRNPRQLCRERRN